MKVAARGACFAAFLGFMYHAFLWAPRPTSGFAMYYTYARLAIGGESLAGMYDAAFFDAKMREFGFNLRDESNNPPSAGLVYMPVAWLGPAGAKIAWSALSLAALACALNILFGISGIRPLGTGGLLLLTLVFLWHPGYDNVAFGQVYFVLLLLFAMSMKGLANGGRAMTSIPLASAILVKGYGVIPAVLLPLGRRWKESVLVVACAAAIVIATLPLFGVSPWGVFLWRILPSLGGRPSDGNVAYQTINGFLRHLFTYDPAWLPHPLVILPVTLVNVLGYALSLGLVCLVLRRARFGTVQDRFLSFSAAVASGVVTAPIAEEYHYVLFLPLVFALSAGERFRGGAWKENIPGTAILALALLFMAAPFHYKVLQDSSFPFFLLAYPRLYAGVAMLLYSRRVPPVHTPA